MHGCTTASQRMVYELWNWRSTCTWPPLVERLCRPWQAVRACWSLPFGHRRLRRTCSLTLLGMSACTCVHARRLRELERAILDEQGRVKTLVWPSAFVTFS